MLLTIEHDDLMIPHMVRVQAYSLENRKSPQEVPFGIYSHNEKERVF